MGTEKKIEDPCFRDDKTGRIKNNIKDHVYIASHSSPTSLRNHRSACVVLGKRTQGGGIHQGKIKRSGHASPHRRFQVAADLLMALYSDIFVFYCIRIADQILACRRADTLGARRFLLLNGKFHIRNPRANIPETNLLQCNRQSSA